jgi:hypothetical protein
LSVGERVRPGLPLGGDPESLPVISCEREQCLVDSAQVRGAALERDEQHAGQQRADAQLAGSDADRQEQLDPAGQAGAVDDLLQPLKLDGHALPESHATSCVSVAGGSWAVRSPSRWLQRTPAACMNA